MQLVKGMVVRSKAGHDKGGFFAVVDVNENFAFIVDGKERLLQKPKKKNLKHLSLTYTVLDEQSMETDSEIRKKLSSFNRKVQSFI